MTLLDLTAKEYAGLDEAGRERALVEAMQAVDNAHYALAKCKAGEAAVLIRKLFPGARWVGFTQDEGDEENVSTTIHLIRADNGETLYSLDVDEEMPDSAPEDYLSGAAEAGFAFRDRGDLLWFDVIDVA